MILEAECGTSKVDKLRCHFAKSSGVAFAIKVLSFSGDKINYNSEDISLLDSFKLVKKTRQAIDKVFEKDMSYDGKSLVVGRTC